MSTMKARRFAVAAAGGVGVSVLTGCVPGSGESPGRQEAACFAPEALQVQVGNEPGEEPLLIASGGIGAAELAADPAPESQRAPSGETPVRELPPGVHARVADLSSGEIVRTETLVGGVARAEPLGEGDYLVGLISVEEPGRLKGLATTELRVDDQGSVLSDPAIDQQRELPITGLELDGDAVNAAVSPGEGASTEAEWWLDGPESQASGTAGEGGSLSIEGVSDGPHTLSAAAESQRAPGIAEQAVRCEFSVAGGDLVQTPGAAPLRTASG